MIHVVDKFLPPNAFAQLSELMISSKHFPWYYANSVAYDNDGEYYFVHNLYDQNDGPKSQFFHEFKFLLYFIEEKLNFHIDHLMRMRCGLYTNQNKQLSHPLHVDYNQPHYTALFYLNTNNGPTTIDGKNFDAVANRLVFFDGLLKHNSNLQTDTQHRMIVNINIQGSFYE